MSVFGDLVADMEYVEDDPFEQARKEFLGIPDPGPYAPYGGLGLKLECGELESPFLQGHIRRDNGYKLSTSTGGEHQLISDGRLNPLLEYLAKNAAAVKLTVGRGENGFFVKDLILRRSTQGSSSVYGIMDEKQLLLRRVIVQLLRSPLGGEAKTTVPYTMKSKEELEFYLKVTGNTLPAGMEQWAREQLALYGKLSFDKDNRMHALRALETVLNIDWSYVPPQIPSNEEIRRILDDNFYGLEPVKHRIMQVAAQIRQLGGIPKWGILLSGGPGTGKTAICRAIASIMNRPLVQLDLNSCGDGEALVGSSRIYHNAQPGIVLTSLASARTANVCLFLNELDHSNSSGRDRISPHDVLLTLLEGRFYDTYTELAVPTSGMFVLASCNNPENIPPALRSRFQMIEIPPYSPEEKRVIYRDFVLPKLLLENSLPEKAFTFSEEALTLLVNEYSREPGVRDLEQHADSFLGDYALSREQGEEKRVYDVDDIRRVLGPSKTVNRTFNTGPGLVVTGCLHEGRVMIFPVEVQVTPGTGTLTILNVEGQSNKDNITAAYTAMKSNHYDRLKDLDVAVYIPQAVPETKDNFLGLATYAAIMSRVLDIPLQPKSAVLGGVDLIGNLFFDYATVDPFVEAFAAKGFTLFCPPGTSELVFKKTAEINIIEAADTEILMEIILMNAIAA